MKNMSLLEVTFGDVLRRPKFFFKHSGVYLGHGLVLHNSPDKGEHVSNVHEFSLDHPIEVIPTPPDKKAEIMRRVEDTIQNPRRYDAPTNNCDHTVTRITEGRAYSPQLVVCILILAITAIAFARGR